MNYNTQNLNNSVRSILRRLQFFKQKGTRDGTHRSELLISSSCRNNLGFFDTRFDELGIGSKRNTDTAENTLRSSQQFIAPSQVMFINGHCSLFNECLTLLLLFLFLLVVKVH
jgi:hypothetical protein